MKNSKTTPQYSDIINLPHHVSPTRPQMSMTDRAAQFSSFAALSGHNDAINETGRLTDRKIELSDDEKALLDRTQAELLSRINELPSINVEYFVPDEKKSGGRYITHTGNLRKIDEARHELVFEDGTAIKFDDVYDIVILLNTTKSLS